MRRDYIKHALAFSRQHKVSCMHKIAHGYIVFSAHRTLGSGAFGPQSLTQCLRRFFPRKPLRWYAECKKNIWKNENEYLLFLTQRMLYADQFE